MDPIQLLFEDNYANEVARDTVEHVYECFLQALELMEKEAKAIPFTADLAMAKLHEIVKLATYEFDGVVMPQEPFEKMDADNEPYPSVIDSWARGTVSTRKVVNDPAAFRRNIPAASGTPSVSSYRSSVTGRSRTTSGNRSHRSTHSRATDRDNDKTGKIIDLDIDGEFGGLNLNATGYMFDMLQKAKKKKSQGYFAIKEGVKGEFDIMSEQIAKAEKEMRGKKFILDRYGIPIAIGKVDPTSLPSFTTRLDLAIKAEGDHESRKDEAKKKKQFVRVAGSRTVDQSSFQPTLSLATTLSGVESIPRLNQGVTVKSRVAERVGEAVEEDPKHMSMKSYISRTSNRSTGSMNDSVFSGARMGETGLSPSRSNMFGSTHSLGSGLNTRSIDSIPEVDPLEGSRRIVIENNYHDVSDHELGLGPAVGGGSPTRSQLPTKPSQQQKVIIDKLRGSPDKGKPRDRDLPQNVKAVAERKHLPAPPPGHVAGHGVFSEKSQMTNNSIDSFSVSETWHRQTRK